MDSYYSARIAPRSPDITRISLRDYITRSNYDLLSRNRFDTKIQTASERNNTYNVIEGARKLNAKNCLMCTYTIDVFIPIFIPIG